MKNMHVVLLSGGSGKRLWPLSNDARSKQFIKFFHTNNANESMIQRVVRQIRNINCEIDLTIATSLNQISVIEGQVGKIDMSVEPCRKDTFPSIVLAACYLNQVKQIKEDDIVVVCPVDVYTDNMFFEKFKDLVSALENSDSNIALIGIKPTSPSEKYGYILMQNGKFDKFVEKPTVNIAKEYIDKGAFWNAGVFAFKIKYILDLSKKMFGTCDYKTLIEKYNELPKLSFDYAVVENENKIAVIDYNGDWIDVGTWNTLIDIVKDKIIGYGTMDDACKNTNIINELNVPILSLGMKDDIIIASPDGILVANKNRCEDIKQYVEILQNRPMQEEREWGEYRLIENIDNINEKSLTKHLVIMSGKSISYQKHKHRNEVWVIVSGNGKVIIGQQIKEVCYGDVIEIPRDTFHSVYAITELHIIEVQFGDIISEDDEEKMIYQW